MCLLIIYYYNIYSNNTNNFKMNAFTNYIFFIWLT